MSPNFAQAYPESAIPTDDWPFFYIVERAYPVTYMIALGMVLLLSYFLVRKTFGLTARSLAGPAYLGLFVSLLIGYGLATSHGQWMFGPPLVQLALSCFVLTIRCSSPESSSRA